MNKEVSFPIAKLLKEKGFDEPCSHAYKEVESPVLYIHQDKKYNNSFKKEWQNTVRKNSHMDNAAINRYSAPTIADVVMWLYEKHGIWIGVQPNEPYVDDDWCFTIFKDLKNSNSLEGYNSPIEAYSAAIEYTLNNLL